MSDETPAPPATLSSDPPVKVSKLKKATGAAPASSAARREIPGNLPYLPASGALKRVLEKIIEAQRPDKFTIDFVETVLKVPGGSGRATIPILKRLGFLSSDGTPTDLYSRFKTDSGRPLAALQAMRNGFNEIFRRSEYAYALDQNKLRDLIIEITGLQKTDPVATAIYSTFNVLKAYVPSDVDPGDRRDSPSEEEHPPRMDKVPLNIETENTPIRLSYNINIVLPETSDLKILNAIFKSVKENLLQ